MTGRSAHTNTQFSSRNTQATRTVHTPLQLNHMRDSDPTATPPTPPPPPGGMEINLPVAFSCIRPLWHRP